MTPSSRDAADVALQVHVRAPGKRKACTKASFLCFMLFNSSAQAAHTAAG